ncbi:hypothetical protein K435DRAFT_332413 [Dendrothele bispora CBS 962.96]|uniref:Sodium/calcium exchanger membrane region domain-containing protein n=1 Tax=Dendrothele bispora (strain CBS 962.96) TaxID=1314807 RepID=A0A4S8MVT7_DENBC|nr:hypothetical protein K435DRAFT_332413 [Dendrothele bispora CBS 962.96]
MTRSMHDSDHHQRQRQEALARLDSNLSTMSTDSRSYLVNHSEDQHISREKPLPLYHYPRHPAATGGKGDHRSRQWMRLSWSELMQGWKFLLFGSWLNVLLLVVPAAWAISILIPQYHGLVFIFCLLALIPLVKLHEVCTHELAIRIGGSKAGLVNATLSNTVEIVVAFSALRKCELQVVQSSLIGSILGKLLLILGLSFFAGGLRFSEQGFDATANQIHSSLLSISVSAVLLPAAYHFALSGNSDVVTPHQRDHILDMSHGVSIILIVIYTLYLIFQLVSHTHLYEDLAKRSRRLSLKVAPMFHLNKSQTLTPSSSYKSVGSDSDSKNIPSAISPSSSSSGSLSGSTSGSQLPSGSRSPPVYPSFIPGTPYLSPMQRGLSNASDVTLADPEIAAHPITGDTTIRLVEDHHGMGHVMFKDHDGSIVGSHLVGDLKNFGGSRMHSQNLPFSDQMVDVPLDSIHSSWSNSKGSRNQASTTASDGKSRHASEVTLQEPNMSVFLTIMTLILVTIAVAFTADWLVEAMDEISTTISKQWIGLILLPAVSSIAECGNAIGGSVQDKLTFSIGVAVGSSIQTALFVIPLMVTLAWGMGKPLALLFDPFESVVLYISVQTMTHVVADGKSNWLEGAILICLYVIIAVSFWFYPGSLLPVSLGAVCTPSL